MFAERFAGSRGKGGEGEGDSEIATGDPDEVPLVALKREMDPLGRTDVRPEEVDFAESGSGLVAGGQVWENMRESCG